MAVKCRGCGRFANNSESVKCTKCATLYHKACVNVAKDAKVSTTWQCPECKVQTPRKDNTETPVAGEGSHFTSLENSPVASEAVCKEILKEIRQHREEFKCMREEFLSLKTHVEGFNSRLVDVETRISSLEEKYTESQSAQPECSAEVEILRSTVDKLKTELNEREQEAFSNDLEITGVPEELGENAGRLFGLIAAKLGVACSENDIVFVERVGLKRAPAPPAPSGASANEIGRGAGAAGAAQATTVRPRALAVRLSRREQRESLLQAARTRRTLTTDGMGLASSPTRMYINERLSKVNKMLFFKTRELARSRGWKFIWTRRGQILVRRENGTTSFRVRTEEDLKKIFGAQV